MTAAEVDEIRRIPKAELHLHLEGSLSPASLWRLAQNQGFPHGLTAFDKCSELYDFGDFPGFIHAIKTASQLLQAPADYAAAVSALALDLQRQGIVYAEVFLSIGILLWRGVVIEPYWDALEAARVAAQAETGVCLRWILDGVRQFGVEPMERVVDWAIKLQKSDSIVAIGIGGDEKTGPAHWFERPYARARAAGLHATVHAGETDGPESVWDAIRLLKAERIGHGVHAATDPKLLDALGEGGIVVDVCPVSNRKTGAWPPNQPYPAHKYYRRGIKLAVASDDPGIFGSDLLEQYAWLAAHGGFSFAELRELALNSSKLGFAR